MTELLYLKDCYLKEFTAKVTRSGEGWVVLDRTAIYAEGGGQESDEGWLEWDGKKARVTEVKKQKGFDEPLHYLEGNVLIPEGTVVKGTVDWARRTAEMRMHSAQHLFSALVLDKYGASTMGNQIHIDKSRIDFAPVKLSKEQYEELAKEFNRMVDEKRAVRIKFLPREQVTKEVDAKRLTLFNRIPASVTEVRVIEMDGVDKAPCGGTHVKNLSEVGHIKILNLENKGKDTQRVEFELTSS